MLVRQDGGLQSAHILEGLAADVCDAVAHLELLRLPGTAAPGSHIPGEVLHTAPAADGQHPALQAPAQRILREGPAPRRGQKEQQDQKKRNPSSHGGSSFAAYSPVHYTKRAPALSNADGRCCVLIWPQKRGILI